MTRKQNPRVIPLEEPGGPYGYATYAARLVEALHDYFAAIPTERQIRHGLASSRVHADEPFGAWKGLELPEDVRHFTARVHVGPRRGTDQDIRVQVDAEENASPHYVVGGALGLNRHRKLVLVITLNGRYTASALASATTPRLVMARKRMTLHLPVEDGVSPMGATIFEQLLQTIRHEVTHASDPDVARRLGLTGEPVRARPGSPDPRAYGRAAYLNDPAEVRAWGHDVVDQVLLFVNRYADVIRPGQLLERALDSSASWNEIEPHLTPRNKQRILSAVYRAVEEARPGALARLRELRAQGEERRENPTPPSGRTLRALGVERMEEALTRAAERLQLPAPGPAYGCGEMGCAAPIGGRGGHRGRVLKVTSDMHEIAAVNAAIEDGVFDGFARVFVPPVALWTAPDPIFDEERTVYAYVREDITPEMLPEGSPERVALIRLKRAADYKRLADFEAALPEVERLVPKVGAFARRLLDRGLMLGDMHAANLGHRPGDPAFVLFDARVKPATVDPLAGIREAFGRNENPARKVVRARDMATMSRAELERLDFDDLSRAAFGLVSGDEILVPPSKLRIRWKADLANAKEDMRRGILRHQVVNASENVITTGAIRGHAPTPRAWAEAVLLDAPPVDVDIVDAKGTYVLQDGHHRYVAAKLLRRPLRAVVQVETNPIDAILAQRPREANPVGGKPLPAAFLAAMGASSAEDAAARAAHVLGVPAPVAVYGCGSMGCAASLPDGRVLKVTLDRSEVRAVEAIVEDGVFDGFARVDVPPRVLWTTTVPWIDSGDDEVTEVYAYVREGLIPKGVEDRPTVSAFARLNEATSYTDERDFEQAVQLVYKYAPAIASLAVRLYDRGLMLGDVHRGNVGTRPGSSELVLFDAQVGYSGGVDVEPEELPAYRRYQRFRERVLERKQNPAPAPITERMMVALRLAHQNGKVTDQVAVSGVHPSTLRAAAERGLLRYVGREPRVDAADAYDKAAVYVLTDAGRSAIGVAT